MCLGDFRGVSGDISKTHPSIQRPLANCCGVSPGFGYGAIVPSEECGRTLAGVEPIWWREMWILECKGENMWGLCVRLWSFFVMLHSRGVDLDT